MTYSKDCKNSKDNKYNKKQQEYILELIKHSVLNEDKSVRYYEELSKLTDSKYNHKIIREICLDKYKHKNILIELYKQLTDNKINLEEEFREYQLIENNFIEEIDISFRNELEKANFYRIMLSLFSELEIRDMLLECLIDDQKHAQLLNWIYSKNMLE